MVRVKICGITRREDAERALTYGADYLGFIFHPASPRAMTRKLVAAVVHALRNTHPTAELFMRADPPRLVGVFVNERPNIIAEILEECGLDLAQLSGDEVAASVNTAESPIFGRAYKAIRPRTISEARSSAEQFSALVDDRDSHMPRLLLDTPHTSLFGGTGETSDWKLAADLSAAMPGLMLAGGLRPENVANAIRQVRPFAVDVASGVEAAPGLKDPDRVREFILNARAVNDSR